jgi:hypothetical protein
VTRTEWLTREAFADWAIDHKQDVLRQRFQDLPVDQTRAVRRARHASPAFADVERFARTAAVLRWVAEGVGKDKVPAWPSQVSPTFRLVETRVSPGRVIGRPAEPPPEVAALAWTAEERRQAVGQPQEFWRAVKADGKLVGWLQVLRRSYKEGGQPRTALKARQVIYADRLGASVTRVDTVEAEYDAAGRVVHFRVRSEGLGETVEAEGTARAGTVNYRFRRGGQSAEKEFGLSDSALLIDPTLLATIGTVRQMKPGSAKGANPVALGSLEALAHEQALVGFVMCRLSCAKDDADGTAFDPAARRLRLVRNDRVVRAIWDADGLPVRVEGHDFWVRALDYTPTDASFRREGDFLPLPAGRQSLVPCEGDPSGMDRAARVRLRARLDAPLAPNLTAWPDPAWTMTVAPDRLSVELEHRGPLAPPVYGPRKLAAETGPPGPAVTKETSRVQANDPEVRKLLQAARKALFQFGDRPKTKAAQLEGFVEAEIRQTYQNVINLSAAEVARKKEGACTEFAYFLTALLRAQDIPARAVTGLLLLPGEREFAHHAWVEAWCDDSWYRLDSAQFALGSRSVYVKLGILDDGAEVRPPQFPPIRRVEVLEVAPTADMGMEALVFPEPEYRLYNQLINRNAFQAGVHRGKALMIACTGNSPSLDPDVPYFLKNATEILGLPRELEPFPYQSHNTFDRLNLFIGLRRLERGEERRVIEKRFGKQTAALYRLGLLWQRARLLVFLDGIDDIKKSAREELAEVCKTAALPTALAQELDQLLRQSPTPQQERQFEAAMDRFKENVVEFAIGEDGKLDSANEKKPASVPEKGPGDGKKDVRPREAPPAKIIPKVP